MTGPLTGEQLVAMLDAFGHAWHCWWQSSTTDEARERGRARDEARRAIVDAYAELRTELAEARESRDRARTAWDKAREYNNKALEKFAAYERELADANTMIGSLGSQLAAVKAERDRLRAATDRLKGVTISAGRLHPDGPTTPAMVTGNADRYFRDQLADDVPDEPTPRRQCDSLLRDPAEPLTLWRCVAYAGHDGPHWSRDRAHEWTDVQAYDINAAEQEQRPYRVWRGACPPVHSDQRWQWACELCDARLCHGGTEAQNRVDAEQHITTQHAEQGGE